MPSHGQHRDRRPHTRVDRGPSGANRPPADGPVVNVAKRIREFLTRGRGKGLVIQEFSRPPPHQSSFLRPTEGLSPKADLQGSSIGGPQADRRGTPSRFEGGSMKKTSFAGVALITLVAAASGGGAQETARVAVSPESKLWIEGTSNLHGWSCKATTLDAAVELDAAAAAQLNVAPPKALKKVQVKVPVKSIKCGHGGMDDNVYKALKAEENPAISYILATFEAVPGEAKDSFMLHTIGTLTIAGKENKVSMYVTATRLAAGSVKATGRVPIKMTDFGIKPPTAIFGRLKPGDEVKVNFELS